MTLSYSEWEELVWALEGILRAHGIAVASPSAFEEAALTLTELEYLRKNPAAYDCTVDSREKWRRAMSLADLAQKIVPVRSHPDFSQLVPHLRLLGGQADLSQFSFTTPHIRLHGLIETLYQITGAECRRKYRFLHKICCMRKKCYRTSLESFLNSSVPALLSS